MITGFSALQSSGLRIENIDMTITSPGTVRFSIVICTDGRAASLKNTLSCIEYLDYPAFEVCVVCGPTEDGTREVVTSYTGRIKVANCPQRNLSMSRNIGIALAAGDIVAFIDDDGLAEPEWLRDLAPAFDNPAVGGAGGVVYDHTGVTTQYLYSTANRLGQADWDHTEPADSLSFPLSFNFPYVQGTNSAFRRSALLEIGGFDEEYEFYLDETDVCCRLIDAGYTIKQLSNAFVHHKFLSSEIRNEHRVARHRYAILKNKIYFSLVNNRGHCGFDRAIRDAVGFIDTHDRDVRFHVTHGRLEVADIDTYWRDVERAWQVGLSRGLSGQRRLLCTDTLDRHAAEYIEFAGRRPKIGRQTFCFISQEYPPGRMGGIGRYVHELSRLIAALGHHVHVLTKGEGHDRVDFEDGVWVHRLLDEQNSTTGMVNGIAVPAHIWSHAKTVSKAIDAIATKRSVTAVYAPMWDCEGVAVMNDGKHPLVVGLQTMLIHWLSSNTHMRADERFMESFANPMLALERDLLKGATGVHAISRAIAQVVEADYDVRLHPPRMIVVPLGLDDWSRMSATEPEALPSGCLRLLFVGRLEARKGIDVLLDVAKRMLPRHSHVHLDIVGNDTIPGPNGVTYRAEFEASAGAEPIRARVAFHGEVNDAQLRGFYRACDVLVAPSRFESFGLMLVEGMMFGKPVIGCRVGGMVEVMEDGETGLLAEPGDPISLEGCMERLIKDADLRTRFGRAGRSRYLAHFTSHRMAAEMAEFLYRIAVEQRAKPIEHLEPSSV
jgi:glycosyltransferase involved in cell wall biosynthesis/GT2 family glycosyltransferase